jgi:hypothetical protein
MKKICNETEPKNGLSHYAIGQASRIASFSRHTLKLPERLLHWLQLPTATAAWGQAAFEPQRA